MYMGPINTRNSPDFNPDSGLAKLLRTNTTKRAEVENPSSRILDRDAFMMNATRTRVTKAGKEPKPALDDPLNLLKDTYGASRAIGIASDLTLEYKALLVGCGPFFLVVFPLLFFAAMLLLF